MVRADEAEDLLKKKKLELEQMENEMKKSITEKRITEKNINFDQYRTPKAAPNCKNVIGVQFQ